MRWLLLLVVVLSTLRSVGPMDAAAPAHRLLIPVVGGASTPQPPILPTIDGAVSSRLRRILRDGQARGHRPDVFIKVGDSNTASDAFLTDIGCTREKLAPEDAGLRSAAEYFRRTTLAGESWAPDCPVNSFTRQSVSALGGVTMAWPFFPLDAMARVPTGCTRGVDSPLQCEIRTTRPAYALVMLGTNDVVRDDLMAEFPANTARLLDTLIAEGVVPVVTMIPPRLVEGFDVSGRANPTLVAIARQRELPIMNLWQALQAETVLSYGLDGDATHLSRRQPGWVGGGGGQMDADGQQFGHPVRNLNTLRVLSALRAALD